MDTQLYKSVAEFGKKFPKISKVDDLLFLLSLSSFQEKFKTNDFNSEDVKSFIIALSVNFETDIFYNAIVASIKLNSESDKSDVFIDVMTTMSDEEITNELRQKLNDEWENFKNGITLNSVMNILNNKNNDNAVESESMADESISSETDESQTNDLENESLFRGPDSQENESPSEEDQSQENEEQSPENEEQSPENELKDQSPDNEDQSQENESPVNKEQNSEDLSNENNAEEQSQENESQENELEEQSKKDEEEQSQENSSEEQKTENKESENNTESKSDLDESNLFDSQSDEDAETEKQRNVYEANLFDDDVSEDENKKEIKEVDTEEQNNKKPGGKISRKRTKKGKTSKKSGGCKKFI